MSASSTIYPAATPAARPLRDSIDFLHADITDESAVRAAVEGVNAHLPSGRLGRCPQSVKLPSNINSTTPPAPSSSEAARAAGISCLIYAASSSPRRTSRPAQNRIHDPAPSAPSYFRLPNTPASIVAMYAASIRHGNHLPSVTSTSSARSKISSQYAPPSLTSPASAPPPPSSATATKPAISATSKRRPRQYPRRCRPKSPRPKSSTSPADNPSASTKSSPSTKSFAPKSPQYLPTIRRRQRLLGRHLRLPTASSTTNPPSPEEGLRCSIDWYRFNHILDPASP